MYIHNMKCTECSVEGDKYTIFKRDSCDIRQCKECGGFTASEEQCLALSERKVILFCSKFREETGTIVGLMQKNPKMKQETEELREI
ncbi:hypothetical protein WA026_021107 [Henosepilachna vigintioctopunctata]|uniref:Uncharacterized protein n=1 Tax=Henosepilachna vigintioctopunctata TaxID=420089 RepID=A0AAW1V2L8_9CUCU